MNRLAVLICTTDPLATALLAASAELEGQDPRFPATDESARDALLRVRPRVAVVECDFPEACDDAFVGPATMLGVRVVFLWTPHSRIDPRPIAQRHGFEVLRLPAPQEAFAELLRRASA